MFRRRAYTWLRILNDVAGLAVDGLREAFDSGPVAADLDAVPVLEQSATRLIDARLRLPLVIEDYPQ